MTHTSWIDMSLLLVGVAIIASTFVRRRPVSPIPDEAPTLFKTAGAGRGVTAADHWADVGSFDNLIYEAEDLRKRLEDIREADGDKKFSYPLSASTLPDAVNTWPEKQVLEFRIRYRAHLEKITKIHHFFQSVMTMSGFPSDIKSLDVLRSVEDHLKRLRELRSASIDKAWSVAQIEIRGLQATGTGSFFT
ncbi:MAG: hypothetical protein WB992_04335 [Bryobacteraceae bacterium]